MFVAKGRLFGNDLIAFHIEDVGNIAGVTRRLCASATLEKRRADKRGEVLRKGILNWLRAPTHPPLPQRTFEVANIAVN